MIQTDYGPAHILAEGLTRDGQAGWYVVLRKGECHAWPFRGKFVFRVVRKEKKNE